MKSKIVKLLEQILKLLAVLTVRKYQPGIIGITGSVGKTSAKEAIYGVLKGVRKARMSRGNFNGQIGIPLTILGEWAESDTRLLSREHPPGEGAFRKTWFLGKVIMVSALRLVFGRRSSYPELLVLEYGADKPGDIKYLIGIAKPQIAVVTAVGDIPAHVEFYTGPEQVAREKGRIVENLPSNGFAILNADDEAVLRMQDRTRAHVITFGFSDEAEIRITNFETRVEEGKPVGISFKIQYGGSFVPVRIDNCFGKPAALAAACAAGLGIVFGVHLVRIAEALLRFETPPHRMRVLQGIKGSTILDDSYNASPLSMMAAVETVKGLPATRKVAVLGDMLEIGEYAMRAHGNLGKAVSKAFSVLVAIGPRAKFIAESALQSGMPKRNVFIFEAAEEAIPKVQDLIKKGDLILIKASWAMHLDRIAHAIKQI